MVCFVEPGVGWLGSLPLGTGPSQLQAGKKKNEENRKELCQIWGAGLWLAERSSPEGLRSAIPRGTPPAGPQVVCFPLETRGREVGRKQLQKQ